jgi:CRP-like cAMP-binding protein
VSDHILSKKYFLLLHSTGDFVQTLYDGSHFGELSLLRKGQKQIVSVKALEICEIYRLSQSDFQRVIEPHKEILQNMKRIAEESIRKFYYRERSSSNNGA